MVVIQESSEDAPLEKRMTDEVLWCEDCDVRGDVEAHKRSIP